MAIDLIRKKEHMSIEGIYKFVELKAFLNKGLTEELKKYFPNITPVERPKVDLPKIINPNWFAGFTSGEGCFSVEILKSSTYNIGFQVILKFSISQHTRDLELLKKFIDFLGGGSIKKHKSTHEFVLVKLAIITENIIPLFKKYPIYGIKSYNFSDFCKIAELMNNKDHLTQNGLNKIIEIKAGMNKNRKFLDPI